MPKRYQRRRAKGFQLPDGVVCVTRPSRWGNPLGSAAEFDNVLTQILEGKTPEQIGVRVTVYLAMKLIAENLDELRGRDLACYCGSQKQCHADSLVKFANR